MEHILDRVKAARHFTGDAVGEEWIPGDKFTTRSGAQYALERAGDRMKVIRNGELFAEVEVALVVTFVGTGERRLAGGPARVSPEPGWPIEDQIGAWEGSFVTTRLVA